MKTEKITWADYDYVDEITKARTISNFLMYAEGIYDDKDTIRGMGLILSAALDKLEIALNGTGKKEEETKYEHS